MSGRVTGPIRRATAAFALVVLLAACSGERADNGPGDNGPAGPGPAAPTGDPAPDGQPGPLGPDGDWQVRAPEELGMDAGTLAGAYDYAFAEGMNTQGVVVVRDGFIVGEWYAEGADEDSWATSWSVAKSFTSALVGIALAEGHIPSVDEPMTTYYPHWEGTGREGITLRHVLQMASGLDFREEVGTTSADIVRMVLSEQDQLAYAADRPYLHPPGTVFNYSSGDSQLLSGVLEQATGMSAADYADQRLFDPLGMDQVEWWQDARQHTLTYCCLDTTTRDFARFGLLYLWQGAWGDRQVVPAQWVADSFTPSEPNDGYGYQWWLRGGGGLPEVFSARGHDGQYIYVVPDHDLVVVRNSTYQKYDGPAVADPNLYDKLPSSVSPRSGLGTRAPPSWDDAAFLAPIIDSIESG